MIEYPGFKVKQPSPLGRGGPRLMEHEEQRRRLLRSTASVALPTLVSRLLGYVRDLLQAYFLGTGHSADAFTIAFTIPNLFRRLTGEGAMTAAFVPTFTELKKKGDRRQLWAFGNIFFYDLALGMAVYFLFLWIFSPKDARELAATVFHAARPGAREEVR